METAFHLDQYNMMTDMLFKKLDYEKGVVSSLFVFLLIWLALFCYILFFRNNALLFWLLILFSIFVLFFQIFFYKNKREQNYLFIEIYLLFFVLLLLKPLYAGFGNLFDLDVYYEIDATNKILTSGYWRTTSIGPVYSFPLLHLFGATSSLITSIDVYKIAQISPLFLPYLSLAFIQLIGKNLLNTKRELLLISAVYILLDHPVNNYGYGRFLFSFNLFLLLVFLFTIRKKNWKIIGLQLVILFLLNLSHPLVSLLAFVFIFTFFVTSFTFSKSKLIKKILGKLQINITNQENHLNHFYIFILFIIFFVIIFQIINSNAINFYINIFKSYFFGKNSGYSPTFGIQLDLLLKIFTYGQVLLGGIVSMIIYKYRRLIRKQTYYVFILFCWLVVLINFSQYLFGVATITFRFTIIFWSFILLPLLSTVGLRRKNNKGLKTTSIKFVCVSVAFLIIFTNICGYNPHLYDKSLSQDLSKTIRLKLTTPERIAVKWVNSSYNVIGNYYISMAFLLYYGNKISVDLDFYLNNYCKNNSYKWFVLDEIDYSHIFNRDKSIDKINVTEDLYASYNNCNILHRVYDSGQINIYHKNHFSLQ